MRRRGARWALTPGQKLELLMGPMGRDDRPQHFASQEEMREAWQTHGGEVATWGNYIPGTRCWAWWAYESPEPPDFDPYGVTGEAQQLRRMGVLTEQEIRDFEEFRKVSIDDDDFDVREYLAE